MLHQTAVCLLLLLLLSAQLCLGYRAMGGEKEYHRPVHRWGRSGKTEDKKYTLEQMGRATFDPAFAAQMGNVDKEDLGYDQDEAEDGQDEDVKTRLREVFPLLDLNHDGFVDVDELWRWHADNGKKAAMRRNRREFNRTDTDKDGRVSLAEYMLEIAEEGEDDLSMEGVTEIADLGDWLGTIKTAYKLADRDGDGALSPREYFDFQFPEESDNEKLQYHTLRQDIHLRDDNHDDLLNYQEFYDGYWNSFYLWVHNVSERWTDEMDKSMSKAKFAELDKNGDMQLGAEELRAAFYEIHPNESKYGRLQADHMMDLADADRDGRLTLKEALDSAHAFYGVTEDEPEYSYHDEL